MYLRQIRLNNVGPIQSLSFSPRFRADGTPVPLILVGRNGSGKSLTLSLLADALVEAKKKKWHTIPETPHEQYLRIMSKRYVRTGADYSCAQLSFKGKGGGFRYNEVISRLGPKVFQEKHPDFRLDGQSQPIGLSADGFLKELLPEDDLTTALENTPLLYFPYFRYERPAWLNSKSEPSLSIKDSMVGISEDSLIQANVLSKTSNWILDVVLDREGSVRRTV